MNSYLEIIVGPMFAGKTKRLISTYNHFKTAGNIIAINNHLDIRYGNNVICSHDNQCIPALMINDLYNAWFFKENEFYDDLHKSDFILINEAQFFKDLYIIVYNMLKHGKKIFLYGLDGDFKQNKFGEILDLIPLCNYIEKLKAICNYCGGHAYFTHRLDNAIQQVHIGNDNYVPLCINCLPNKDEFDIANIAPVD
jgi:thymidine kinase